MRESVIKIENLSYKYEKGSLALKNINIDIKKANLLVLSDKTGRKIYSAKNITGFCDQQKEEFWLTEEIL